MNGEAPLEVTAVVDRPEGLEVDEHSITICRYRRGLSKLETRWGAFTDPWITQPQPKCGFVIVGTEGTISSYDFEPHVGLQTRAHPAIHEIPVDVLEGAVSQAGRIRAALQREWPCVRGPARSSALPHGAKDRRYRSSLRRGSGRTLPLLP